MIDSSKFLESLFQQLRFKKVLPFINGSVLDFGGNKGELGKHVKGTYTLVNYDHTPMNDKKFDTIVALAVIEHIEVAKVFEIFKVLKSKLNQNAIIFLTTPTPMSRPILNFLAFLHVLDRENIKEHKHYWTKQEIFNLAKITGLHVRKYKKFQAGFNQLAIFENRTIL